MPPLRETYLPKTLYLGDKNAFLQQTASFSSSATPEHLFLSWISLGYKYKCQASSGFSVLFRFVPNKCSS